MSVTLLKVIERLPPHIGTELNPAFHVERTSEYRKQKARRYLLRLASRLQANGLVVDCMVREGIPGPEVIKEALLEPETMLAMSSHGRYGLSRLWFGSVTDEVLHKADIPMFIVGPNVSWDPKMGTKLVREIVALDGSAFAEKVLPLAVDVASALGLKMALAKVTPGADLYYYQNGEGEGEEEDSFTESLDARAGKYLNEIRRRLGPNRVRLVESRVLHGPKVSEVLIEYADEASGSLIALTTHARTGLARGMLGSVVEELIHESPHPLLVLHVKGRGASPEKTEAAKSDFAASAL